ncbi:MAG: serine hydrolase [Gammaproteobacteria bacterium]|nr:serine hydrolase [Gammaproteobacteria bacterium]
MRILIPLLALGYSATLLAYPLYEEDTGIRRLEHARLAHEGVVPGRARLAGELLAAPRIDLGLRDRPTLGLPAPDAAFMAQIRELLGAEVDRYSVSVLDLSDPQQPRYAEHRATTAMNPGSVGKILVALGLFQTLADVYPDDLEARRRVLRETRVIADEFIHHDHHKIRLWDPETRTLERRPLREGDEGSLWEYLDWMLSASANAAAAMVQQQAMLLAHYGRDYPVAQEKIRRFFAETPRGELGRLLERTLQEPVTRNGLDLTALRQGSLFTRTGKNKVPGTNSYATTREMMRLLLRLEQGRLVDAFSSLELKRLLYVTERRIRYASSPALREAAVYFKSGSLYSCEPEPGFTCRKYRGNKRNYMNSVAIVEAPAADPHLYYMVALTSNVLRRNSAVDHQTFATRVHRLIEQAHPASTTAPPAQSEAADPTAGEGDEP